MITKSDTVFSIGILFVCIAFIFTTRTTIAFYIFLLGVTIMLFSFHPICKSEKTKKKHKDSQRNAFDKLLKLQAELSDPKSKLRCQKCHMLLPIIRLGLKAKSVKHNQDFEFKCKCGYVNVIKKEYGKDQCFKCGKIIDPTKENICNKCFKKEKKVSEK